MGWVAKIHNSQTLLQLGFGKEIRFTQVQAGTVWKVKARREHFPVSLAVAVLGTRLMVLGLFAAVFWCRPLAC